MKINIKTMLVMVSVILLIFGIGCIQLQEEEKPTEPNAEEIVTKTISKMKEVSYEFSGSMEIYEGGYKIPFSGKVGDDNGYLVFQSEDKIGFPKMEYYQVGNIVYSRSPLDPSHWIASIVKDDRVFIEDDIKLLGSEKVDGEDCWIMGFKPRIGGILEQELEKQGISKEDLTNLLERVQTTGKYWITKDYEIRREEITCNKLAITTNLDFKPVKIELPEETKDAESRGFSAPIQYDLPNTLGILTAWRLGIFA